jgi:hypothetical protein
MSTILTTTLLTSSHLDEIYSLLTNISSGQMMFRELAEILGHNHFRLIPNVISVSPKANSFLLSLTLQIGNWVPGLDGGINGSFFEVLDEKIAIGEGCNSEDAYMSATKLLAFMYYDGSDDKPQSSVERGGEDEKSPTGGAVKKKLTIRK